MKTIAIILAAVAAAAASVCAQTPDISFQHEVEHAIDHGLEWLKANQNPTNGTWSTPDQPAVTALALTAFMGEPSGVNQTNPPECVQKGFAFVTNCAKDDGAIYNKGLQNYNTAISMMALIAAKNPAYQPMILRARQWIMTQQVDEGEPGKIDSPNDGGVGYGDHGKRSDMNNTFTALEALYYSKQLASDQKLAGAKDLNWAAAIHFIESCQNLPAYNKQPWASDDEQNKGGFIYDPSGSKAGASTNAAGRVTLRSYGSISYAGMMSYLFCDLKHDDARVTAVYDWARRNYTIEENPGMGQQGYYYYLHMMTKALTFYGADRLETKDGKMVDWRRDVAMKLINLQHTDGSWSNANNRWWEHDPALVTSYSLIALEMLHHQL